jgi:LacI family transcriptional regulator
MATIKDVARLAQVGVGTASRVVSGKGSVAPATAQRIRQAIEELNFKPSHAARTLLSGSSQMIGVYIPLLKGTFYTPILQTIDTELRTNGRHMVLAFGRGEGDAREQAMEGVEFLIDRGCDGLVVMSSALREEDVASLGAKQQHLLILNHRLDAMADQCFQADHSRAGILAAQTLLQFRHRKYAVISGPDSAPDNVERIAAFMGELVRQGIDPNAVWTLKSDFSPEGGWAAARALVNSGHAFTALFCANDEMAVGALSYFQQVGISVPGQVSVLGYDNTHAAEYSAPRLTSVHIPWRDITLSGLHWLLNRCYGTSYSVVREFPISVTWRASVAMSPAGDTDKNYQQV